MVYDNHERQEQSKRKFTKKFFEDGFFISRFPKMARFRAMAFKPETADRRQQYFRKTFNRRSSWFPGDDPGVATRYFLRKCPCACCPGELGAEWDGTHGLGQVHEIGRHHAMVQSL